MATITLGADTNYSALSVSNGDTIALAGFQLTFDVVPSETGVIVTTVGSAGKVVFGLVTAYPLVGWSMTAGTTALITSIASGVTVGANLKGGTSFGAAAVLTNDGTISGTVTAGTGPGTVGVSINNGTISGTVTGSASVGSTVGVITNNGLISGSVVGGGITSASGVNTNSVTGIISGSVTGGSGGNARGINSNQGVVSGACLAGTGSGASAISTNTGLVSGNVSGIGITNTYAISSNIGTVTGNVTGGSVAGAYAIFNNQSGVISGLVTGGSAVGAFAINSNNGSCIGGLVDSVGYAIGSTSITSNAVLFVNGPLTTITFPSTVSTIYSLFGPLNPSAVVDPATTVITLKDSTFNPFHSRAFGGRL